MTGSSPSFPCTLTHFSGAETLIWTEGYPIRVVTAEGLILTKMVAFRPQDQIDIDTLLTANRDNINIDLIREEWSPFAATERRAHRVARSRDRQTGCPARVSNGFRTSRFAATVLCRGLCRLISATTVVYPQRAIMSTGVCAMRRSHLLKAGCLLIMQLIILQAPLSAGEIPVVSAADAGLSEAKLAEVDKFMDHQVADKKIAGGIVIVSHGGKIGFFHAYGQKDIEANQPDAARHHLPHLFHDQGNHDGGRARP